MEIKRKIAIAVVCLAIVIIPAVAGLWWYQANKDAPASKTDNGADVVLTDAAMAGNLVLGRPTDTSITANVLATKGMAAYVEYGTSSGVYSGHTETKTSVSGEPIEITVDGLSKDTHYFYRLQYRQQGQAGYNTTTEHTFHTQRSIGSTFTFGVQGDSHPDRPNKMYDSALYALTMENVAKGDPDLYFTLGDDFSIEGLIDKDQVTQQKVDEVYVNQRKYLSTVGCSASLFLTNGNHEQAARYLLDGTADNPAVKAGVARNRYYPLPAPDDFYTGDSEPVENVGLPRDYYAFTWGDALFVTLDFYWHSPVAVDNVAGGGEKRSNMWDVTLGDEQYQWFRDTLAGSDAKYKFVFCHHVLGTGRGGIEVADGYEWGGETQDGTWGFDKNRPGWEAPIHQLMVKYGVTVFFFGHDHVFAHQEKDGVTYQEVTCPADPTYTAFNKDAYLTGDVLSNSGHLRVTVAPDKVTVDYIRSWLPKDETGGHKNGEVAFTYSIPSK